MVKIGRATTVKFISQTPTTGHESCGLLDRTSNIRVLSDSALHPEPAHVRLDTMNSSIIEQLVDTIQYPTSRTPWMFVQEMTSLRQLIPIDFAAKLHVLNRLDFRFFELPHPIGILAMSGDVQLL
jgi:hypothetical protein